MTVKSHILYLDVDPNPVKLQEFKRVAIKEEYRKLKCEVAPVPVHTGSQMVLAAHYPSCPDNISHLALVMHGTTAMICRPSAYGVHVTTSVRGPFRDVVNVDEFAKAWKGRLTDHALISLCACSCARSPHWYLTQLYGAIVPDSWSEISYRSGGAKGFAGKLRDAFVAVGKKVTIHAHCTVGHVTYNPIIRTFYPVPGEDGKALFEIALPDVEPTWANRRRWVDIVRGQLARDYFMGDCEELAIEKIRSLWGWYRRV
jgi:hypothetical protein